MRAIIIVIDGLGIGYLPDARKYNDYGANTLKSLFNAYDMQLPVLESLGLLSIDGVFGNDRASKGAFGRIAELSNAKDTTVGHWEIAGVVTDKPFPVFPNGFPKEFISKLEKAIGRKVIVNKPYSGTAVIAEYGEQHLKTGCPILYTSADSVLQIACHTDIVPINQLYDWCQIARDLCVGSFGVGRVIARPFSGVHPFIRTEERKDFSVAPPTDTLLDNVKNAGMKSIGIGKIEDIFCFKGLTDSYHTHDNKSSFDKTIEVLGQSFDGLVFVNLIDTDMLYGHRRDVFGYAQCLEEIDKRIGHIISKMRADDVLYVTSDHGNDPCHKVHTDHTREYVPLLIYGRDIIPTNLGTLTGFDTIAETIRQQLNLPYGAKSLWDTVIL